MASSVSLPPLTSCKPGSKVQQLPLITAFMKAVTWLLERVKKRSWPPTGDSNEELASTSCMLLSNCFFLASGSFDTSMHNAAAAYSQHHGPFAVSIIAIQHLA